MLSAGELKKFKDMEIIFREDDEGKEMFLINSGKVKITKNLRGYMARIAILNEGDFFGEMALFEDAPRSATAMALENTEVLALDKEALLKLIQSDPNMALNMLKKMSERIRKIDEELTRLIVKGLLPKEEAQKISRYTLAGFHDGN